VTEWAGWSFADNDWWAEAGGDQRRTEFVKSIGAAAIADGDEWDDLAREDGLMATYLSTAPISLDGAAAGSVVLQFDSSWRPEPIQKANVAPRAERQLIQLRLDRLHNARVRKADMMDVVAMKIEVAAALEILNPRALTTPKPVQERCGQRLMQESLSGQGACRRCFRNPVVAQRLGRLQNGRAAPFQDKP
jgi:hypothetical protein